MLLVGLVDMNMGLFVFAFYGFLAQKHIIAAKRFAFFIDSPHVCSRFPKTRRRPRISKKNPS
jgi:hypothetical protein